MAYGLSLAYWGQHCCVCSDDACAYAECVPPFPYNTPDAAVIGTNSSRMLEQSVSVYPHLSKLTC